MGVDYEAANGCSLAFYTVTYTIRDHNHTSTADIHHVLASDVPDSSSSTAVSGNRRRNAALLTLIAPVGVPRVGHQPVVYTRLYTPAKNSDGMAAKSRARLVLVDTWRGQTNQKRKKRIERLATKLHSRSLLSDEAEGRQEREVSPKAPPSVQLLREW